MVVTSNTGSRERERERERESEPIRGTQGGRRPIVGRVSDIKNEHTYKALSSPKVFFIL